MGRKRKTNIFLDLKDVFHGYRNSFSVLKKLYLLGFILQIHSFPCIQAPRLYNFFHAQKSMKFQLLIKGKMVKSKDFSFFKLLDVAFNLLINVKMTRIVGILTFMIRVNFKLS